ncbi:hypothetical protein [Staphylococcus hyicus]|uniref:hypothetical protein n=1 Tax=Staphylococcus hyicus TaxID=1284 RepID=UPI0036D3FE93
MLVYDGNLEEQGVKTEFTKSAPRKWTKEEEEWIVEKKLKGHSVSEIAKALNRTEVSISIKLKRLKKRTETNTYNEHHLEEKYGMNSKVASELPKNAKVLDLFCGVNSYWKNTYKDFKVTTNDKDNSIDADYNMDAHKLICKLYSESQKYDFIDLDPFGSAYDCFDLAIKMAKKGLYITFGEIGHKRWNRLDYVSKRYDIKSLDEFNLEKLIEKVMLLGLRNKKTLKPKYIGEYRNISRVYFEINDYKETSQWVSS